MSSAPRSWNAWRESTRSLAQGSSTSSKVPQVEDVEPAQIVRGRGCRVWDADGNEYIDFRNALGPVTLGYAVPEVNAAIAAQLENGILFGHPHPLEGDVARLLCECIPCAERLRFLKTGGEALAATIKIARNATQRNRILHCGYNGWLQGLSRGGAATATSMGPCAPDKGVPAPVSDLHATLPWGDLAPWKQAFEDHGTDIAACMVAADYAGMEKGHTFLPALRALTREHGALLILDEIVTGFRLALGGAQEYFGVDPDMAVFSKGIANGMPVSVYAGRADLIDSAKSLGISSTFAGETLSLAACKAVIGIYRNHAVVQHLWDTGRELWGRVQRLLADAPVPITLEGAPVCPRFMDDAAAQQALMRAGFANGLSLFSVPYVNWSHKPGDVEETCARFEKAIAAMKADT